MSVFHLFLVSNGSLFLVAPFCIPLPPLIVCKRCTSSEIRLTDGELPESQSCVGTGGEWTEVILAENVINRVDSGEIWAIMYLK